MPTARSGVMGPPRNSACCVPETTTTVQASGNASAMAGLFHELGRVGGVGYTGFGLGSVPAGVGGTGWSARFVGVIVWAIHAARGDPYSEASPRHGAFTASAEAGGFPARHTASQYVAPSAISWSVSSGSWELMA